METRREKRFRKSIQGSNILILRVLELENKKCREENHRKTIKEILGIYISRFKGNGECPFKDTVCNPYEGTF